ncbi:MAG: 4Fe-4S binding protein [Anaerolineae bacterium]|jgi:polyferredoxin|nr:4Fe-4S binding protein [Anaerolineae bacterium]MBT4309609.1 4Fe-4S binding protein [Anaerolineae bacterium]MBT4456972.1 4Fe-4S binding protein [Anaerolineae bacterium]MBT4843242.1 4Fe-4S binding protein [Anaerolineae bacterium]MBT6060669.1 4Fe-4S binding protein [Anaerolineae bacterium]
MNLLHIPLIKALLKNRWPQFTIIVIALAGFILAILSGFFGTPVGSRNFGIIFVWIAWWAILMLVAVPFFGRGWCGICPIPAPGEWIQRGAMLGPRGQAKGATLSKSKGLGRRWPKRFRNIWLQNGSFLLVALFSTVILTQPRVTAIVLVAFLFVAVGASLIFERRAFCRYLCPVGGFIGLYSQLAPVEVRVVDTAVCKSHTEKTCYTGNDDGYGCPWDVFPPGMVKNTYCGTCMECLRTCPHDNIAINIRAIGTDLSVERNRKLDEAYKAFIMLGAAAVYSAVLLGPWGTLKLAAYSVGTLPWMAYATSFLTLILLALPGIFWLMVWFGKRLSDASQPTKKLFISQAYALIPLGLTAWIAFSLSFVFANFSYVLVALSDPFGWGWDLIGTAGIGWTPWLTNLTPFLQVGVLVGGFIWAAITSSKIASEKLDAARAARLSTPVIGFCLVFTLTLMGLLIA